MENKIKVSNLIQLFDADKTKDKTNLFSQVKFLDYLPYDQKIAIATVVISTTCINHENGNIYVNSPMRSMYTILTMLSVYTNIDITLGVTKDGDDAHEVATRVGNEFDEMNKRGLISLLFERIPEREREEFKTVMDMVYNDMFTNKYEPHAYIDELLDRLSNVITPLLSVLEKAEGLPDEV